MFITFGNVPGDDRPTDVDLPPGQYLVSELPVPPGAAPVVRRDEWEFTLTTENGQLYRWDWAAIRALPSERISLDLHCASGRSVLASNWDATSLHQLFTGVRTSAEYVLVHSYGDYSTNLPLEDLLEMPTWLAFSLEGHDLTPEQGGPVRLLVPHLYLWKSVRWVRGITLVNDDQPGTMERSGYHNYGDPWRQQRTDDD